MEKPPVTEEVVNLKEEAVIIYSPIKIQTS